MRSFNAKYVCPFDAGSDRGSSCKNVPQQATWAGGGSRRKCCASACSCCYLRQVCGMLTSSLPGGLPAASCSHKLFAFRELNCQTLFCHGTVGQSERLLSALGAGNETSSRFVEFDKLDRGETNSCTLKKPSNLYIF